MERKSLTAGRTVGLAEGIIDDNYLVATLFFFNFPFSILTIFLIFTKNGKWQGLISEIVDKKYDMVLTSLKINADREAAIDFTAPFLESGTTILVAKRTGIISPTAFLGKSTIDPHDQSPLVKAINEQ